MGSALKAAFAAARREGNIDLVLDPLLAADLQVFGRSFPPGEPPSVFLTRMPDGQAFCWTAAEDPRIAQTTGGVDPIPYTGKALMAAMPEGHGLVLMWDDGGDQLTPDHLRWLKRLWVEREIAASH